MAAYVRRVVTTVLGRDAVGAKFRVSDNDNTDAAAFHRDAIRAPGATPFELLTCIVYLDDAAMQVIPGSHVRTYGAIEALAIAPQTLEFRAGDVMLFHAGPRHIRNSKSGSVTHTVEMGCLVRNRSGFNRLPSMTRAAWSGVAAPTTTGHMPS
jgi:hypothetical protein